MPVQNPSPDNVLTTILFNSPANDGGSTSASPGASGPIDGADGIKAIQDATHVEAVVAAMRKHAEIAELQHEACKTLLRNNTGNEDFRAKAGNAGAVEAVVAAMQGHREHAELQRAACMMLICTNTGNADNSAKAGTAGAIDAVVVAMQGHIEHAELQLAACRCCFS